MTGNRLPSYLHGWGRACMVMLLLLAGAQAVSVQALADARGRVLPTGPVERIVTLGSDVTEIVDALGAAGRIVGVDKGSGYPAVMKRKPNVGYRRQLAVEGLAALDPDLILAADDIGPPEAVDVLLSLGMPIVFIPQDNTADGIQRKIALVSATLGLEEQGRRLSASVLQDFDRAAAIGAAVPESRRKKVVFFHGLVKLTAAGAGTAADAIIRQAGGINPMAVVQGYKAASEEKLVEMAPDVVLMMGDGKGGPTADEVFANRALAATPAGRNRALVVLDGAYMIGFGPRTAAAIRDLAQALYPDAAQGRPGE